MRNVYDINLEFERMLGEYTGAPYVATLDCCSNALFLALKWCLKNGEIGTDTAINVPQHTYPSVPCSVIHNGLKIKFIPNDELQKGEYRLAPSRVWDSALTFRKGMYRPGQIQCISFNARKHLKLPSGGAILTDDYDMHNWIKKMRFSGRNEVDYLVDTITEVGYRMYMIPEIATTGIKLLGAMTAHNDDIILRYLDLSVQPAYKPHTI